jgi:hypothetical protein
MAMTAQSWTVDDSSLTHHKIYPKDSQILTAIYENAPKICCHIFTGYYALFAQPKTVLNIGTKCTATFYPSINGTRDFALTLAPHYLSPHNNT